MIESIFKSFNVSNVTENLSCPLFWNVASKKAQLYVSALLTMTYKKKQFCFLPRDVLVSFHK